MIRHPRARRLAGLGLVAMVLTAAACGDDDDDTTETTGAAASTTAAPTTTTGSPGGSSTSAPASSADATTTTEDASAAFEQVVTDAEDEGQVLMYTSAAQATLDKLEPAFEKAYPDIDLQIFHGNTGEVIARLTAEKQSGKIGADFLLLNQDGEPSTIATMSGDGMVVDPIGPTFGDEEVEAAINGDYFTVYGTVFGWAWNTQLVPNGIDSWEDFLDPALKGKVGVFDPTQSSIIPACYAAEVEAAGPTFLEDLAAQEPRIYPGGVVQEAAVGSGEIAVTAFSTKRILGLKAQGAPVEFAVPPAGACVPVQEGAILKDGEHPNAAQVFADWLMSVDGQTVFLESAEPARSDVPGAIVDFADLTPSVPVGTTEHQEFIATFNQLFR